MLRVFALAVLLCATVLRGSRQFPGPDAGAVERLDGSTITTAEIDSAAERLVRAGRVTGLGMAILNRNQIVYLKAYGYRDSDTEAPLTVDSVMTAASLSKAAFAYLVMQLAGRRILDLDTPVARYLPRELPQYDGYKDLAGDQRWRKITARMLLDHTSGFPNWRRFEDDQKLHIHFEPGARFAYSGEGMVLLQMVVEALTRQPLEQLMRDNIFEPFGMSRSSMVWEQRFEDDFANGYDERGGSLGPQRRHTADAAGGMQTTVHDYARLLQALLSCKRLEKPFCDEMLSPQVAIVSKHEFPSLTTETSEANRAIRLSYGLGWGLYFTPYGKAFFKEGHDDGWRHYAVCFPDKKMGLLMMTNSANGEGIYEALLEKLQNNKWTPLEWERFTP